MGGCEEDGHLNGVAAYRQAERVTVCRAGRMVSPMAYEAGGEAGGSLAIILKPYRSLRGEVPREREVDQIHLLIPETVR